MAEFNVVNITDTTIEVSVTGLAEDHSYNRNFYWYINGDLKDTTITEPFIGSTSFTYAGLTPETQYNLSVDIWNYDLTILFATLSASATTKKKQTVKISPWEWTETEAAALNGKGLFSTIVYTRWNDFVDKIIEVDEAAKITVLSEEAKVSENDKVLTAYRFNLVRANIDNMVATGIEERSKGDPVLGAYFITLQSCLNQKIAELAK